MKNKPLQCCTAGSVPGLECLDIAMPSNSSFYALIDRLQKHSEWKYPDRKWTNDTYYGIAFHWLGKGRELEERVIKLEAEMEAKNVFSILK